MSITEQRDPPRDETQAVRVLLRDYVVEAIYNGGYGKVIPEQRPRRDRSLLLRIVCALAIYVGYAFVAMQLGLSWPWAIVAGIVATSVAVLVVATAHRFEASTVKRTLGVGKKVIVDIPLLFPVVALVTFTLILNAEVWLVGAAQTPTGLAVLGTIAIVPLVMLLGVQLIRSIKDVVDDETKRIKSKPSVKNFEAAVKSLAGRRAGQWVKAQARSSVRAACSQIDSREVSKHVYDKLSGTFKRRIFTRLALSVATVAIAAFLIIYGLAALMVNEAIVLEWTKTDQIDYWVVAGVSLPLGPYPRVAAMLAIILTSIFVSLVLTTKDLRDGFRTAYVERPAATAVMLTAVYRWALRT